MPDLFAGRHSLPVILQSERAECGLACLAMVASYHGKRMDLNSLRQRYAVSLRGATLGDLQGIARDLSLQTRALRLDISDLPSLQLPAILHWDMNHFVVLKAVGRQGAWIHDPATGLRRYALEEVGHHFTGVALECLPLAQFEPSEQVLRSRLRDLFVTDAGFVTAVAQLLLLSAALQAASIGSAFYLQLVIDEGIAPGSTDMLTVLALGFALLALASVGMRWVRGMLQLHFSNQLGFQMAGNVLHHLMRLPADYFARRHTGDLVSRFGAIREIRQVLSEELLVAVLDGLFAVAALLAMFWFNRMLALVVLVFVLLEALLRLAVTPTLRQLSEQRITAEARTSTQLMESMRAMEIIKFYCAELARIHSWRNQHAQQINAQVQLSRLLVRVEAGYGVLHGLEHVLVVYLAAKAVVAGTLTLGFVTAFIALKSHFASSIRAFIDKLVQMRLLRLQLERVSDITCAEPEFASLHLPVLRLEGPAALQLKQVSYTYPGMRTPVFSEVNLLLEPGEILAITGASGCGKSTLMRLLAGLLQPDAGQRLVDGEALPQDAALRRYRDSCAGVLQGEQLLSGTLLENVTMFAEQVDHLRLQQAARRACIDGFIAALPMGWNSLIGDMGSIMSAGQGQRVLLARAFYKQPRILFLDEATAHLDPQVELDILFEIKALGVTTVLVTHRRAPLGIATRVLHMAQGRLCENVLPTLG